MGCGASNKVAVEPEPPQQPTPKDNGAPEDVKPPKEDELPGEPKVKDDTIKLFVHAFLKDHFVESYLVLDQHEGLVRMLGKKNSPLNFYTAMLMLRLLHDDLDARREGYGVRSGPQRNARVTEALEVRKRFEANSIYTNINAMMLAVNPYKDLGLYVLPLMRLYGGYGAMQPPNNFGTAAAFFKLGLVGTNGIGKSTALKILAGKLQRKYDAPPDWQDILQHFRGSELQNYFPNMKAIINVQYVDLIPKAVKGQVLETLEKKDELSCKEAAMATLDLQAVAHRNVADLSGGELQRFAIAMVLVQKADVYMFDEPSSYLDMTQRLKAARAIRSLLSPDTHIITVEHDLSVLDYLSDFICCLYGVPGAYGVVTLPFGVREGISIFLAGFTPTENLRFRDSELTFKVSENADLLEALAKEHKTFTYPNMTKTMGDFKLTVQSGSFSGSEILVMLGENGAGKTTFIRMIAGQLPSGQDEKKGGGDKEMPQFNVSYKPHKISPKFEGTVRMLLHKKIGDSMIHLQFMSDVMKPMKMNPLMDNEVRQLSGGELQRVALVIALGTPADLYLIDEPSAYLDSEQRISAAKVIKRFIMHAKKTGFIVEHDFIMATYLADRVIVYEGTPSVTATATSPQSLLTGMNQFLKSLEVTFRRDPENYRPRINKMDSVKDVEQKQSGNFFFMDD